VAYWLAGSSATAPITSSGAPFWRTARTMCSFLAGNVTRAKIGAEQDGDPIYLSMIEAEVNAAHDFLQKAIVHELTHHDPDDIFG
jgi:hypothetical protein